MLLIPLNPGVLHMHCKLELSIYCPSQHVYCRSEPSFTKRVREKQKSKVGRARDDLLRFGYRLYSAAHSSQSFPITET